MLVIEAQDKRSRGGMTTAEVADAIARATRAGFPDLDRVRVSWHGKVMSMAFKERLGP